MRDSQRSKCYNWQTKNLGSLSSRPVTLTEAQSIVNDLSAHFNVAPVPTVVTFTSKNLYGQSQGRGRLIHLSTNGGLQLRTLLHEFAHQLIFHWRMTIPGPNNYFRDEPGHGPYYMRAYLNVLEHYTGRDYSATCAGLRVAHPECCVGPDPVAHWNEVATAVTAMTRPAPATHRAVDRGHHYYCMYCHKTLARVEIKFCSYVHARKWLAANNIPDPIGGMTYAQGAAVLNKITAHWVWDKLDRGWYNEDTEEFIPC